MENLLGLHQILPISFLCTFMLSISGCAAKQGGQMIEQDYLQRYLEVGQVLKLSSLEKMPDGHLCVLYPYQQSISEGVPYSTRINAYLKSTGYVANESHWAFIIVMPKEISLSKFKRSKKLDILATHEIQPEHRAQLPKIFVPASCVPLDVGAIVKIESRNRIFLVVGEMK